MSTVKHEYNREAMAPPNRTKIMSADKIIHIKQYNRDYYKNIGILRKYNKKTKSTKSGQNKSTPSFRSESHIAPQTENITDIKKKIVDKIIVTF